MSNQKRFIDQLQQLVGTPSVSCTQPSLDMGNRPVIDLLANWLQALGFEIDIQPLDDPSQTNLPVTQQKANLIATLGKGDGGLVFSGHSDTVPYDQNRWEQDPFQLKIDDNRAFGLGATDMKGFFPTVLAAIEPFIGKELAQPIIILATADEETSMTGARALVNKQQPKAAYAIVGEPTGMRPIRMHKGITMESIRIQGKAGHSSNPSLGNNALDVMHDVIGELKQFRQQLQSQHQHAGFDIEVPTLNLGCIHGGDNPNRICGRCELEFDIRPLPGMKLDHLREDIDQRLDEIAEKNNIIIERESLFPGVDAFEQAEDSTLIKSVEALTQQPSESVAFATEAPFLQALGMEVVVMGPGSIDQAHQPN
ncbi:MAG: acetylornithine deacetylase, partial [Cellvibrionaceae bacterium]